MRTLLQISLLLTVVLGMALPCRAQKPVEVGIEEHLGEYVPLKELTFQDERGQTVKLDALFDRPVILTLVYYRCPGICTPLLLELVDNIDKSDLVPGEDYRIVTISFDPTETAALAQNKKTNMIAQVKSKEVPPSAWRFLTGDEENVRRIAETVGFHYTKDVNGVDYVHAATVIFVAPDGKISRYLNGTRFNPADLKMAVIDAAQGRTRSFIQRVERLCYTFDTDGQSYVLKVNRIILGVTLLFAMVFGVFLLAKRGPRRRVTTADAGESEA